MRFSEKIREFFWPLLEPLNKKDFLPFNVEELTVKEDDLDMCCDLTLRYYDSENERIKAIESKSTIFISCVGFVIAILLSMATGLLINPNISSGFLASFSVFMWVVIVIYFCRAVWFSIRALERQDYHMIGHKDYVAGGKDYRRMFITEIINKTRRNSPIINLKVDNMVMAQEYFKRGIVAAAMYALIAGAYGLAFKAHWNYREYISTILQVLTNNWVPFLNAGCLFINIGMFVLLRIEKRKTRQSPP